MNTAVPFDTSVELLIYLFIILAMLCIGMGSTLAEFGALLRDRDRTTRALVVNVVVPPIIAVLIVTFIPMEESVAVVLLLLAFAPGGINAVQFSTKAPGQLALAGELLLLFSAVGLVTAPLAAGFILPSDASVGVPLAELAFRVLGLVAGPLVVGMALRARAPAMAERLYKPAMLVSTLAFIASVVLSLGIRQDALAMLASPTLIAMLVFVLVLMAAGWIAGGPETDRRQVLAVATNLRNVGLVYVLINGCCEGQDYSAAVLAFMAVMVPLNLGLTLISAVLRKRRAV
jgi:BASS family bile acid:Na+ symporter